MSLEIERVDEMFDRAGESIDVGFKLHSQIPQIVSQRLQGSVALIKRSHPRMPPFQHYYKRQCYACMYAGTVFVVACASLQRQSRAEIKKDTSAGTEYWGPTQGKDLERDSTRHFSICTATMCVCARRYAYACACACA